MFYVNSSTGNTLDPRPAKGALEATTLIGLLQKISSKFKKGSEFSQAAMFFMFGQLLLFCVAHFYDSFCFLCEAFREILERKASAHPFENVQSLLPPNSWLGSYPIPGNYYFS